MSSVDIEKKSLEAHVEICAVRYSNLENQLSNLESRMDKVESYLIDIKNTVASMSKPPETKDDSGPYKVMIAIGTTLLGALIGGMVTLIVNIK
jgi:chaperonin cofactor prefoldin